MMLFNSECLKFEILSMFGEMHDEWQIEEGLRKLFSPLDPDGK